MTLMELLGAIGIIIGCIFGFVIAALCLFGLVYFFLEKLGYIDPSESPPESMPYVGAQELARRKRQANIDWSNEHINYMTGKHM